MDATSDDGGFGSTMISSDFEFVGGNVEDEKEFAGVDADDKEFVGVGVKGEGGDTESEAMDVNHFDEVDVDDEKEEVKDIGCQPSSSTSGTFRYK